jgi:hypothetical protein
VWKQSCEFLARHAPQDSPITMIIDGSLARKLKIKEMRKRGKIGNPGVILGSPIRRHLPGAHMTPGIAEDSDL